MMKKISFLWTFNIRCYFNLNVIGLLSNAAVNSSVITCCESSRKIKCKLTHDEGDGQ